MIDDERSRDMCPICKTDRYLSPNMNFLINPECYHNICESCVDRIFSLGPAPCPYPKCGKILRKNKFKKQVFDDLKIEKEVDLRRRISAIYNKTEDDFDDLKEYNLYLEHVETLVFNLINGVDVEATEQEIKKYEQDHKIDILEINMRESQKTSDLEKYQEAMERMKQEKLKIQHQMELEDLEYQKQQKQSLLDRLSSSNIDSDEIIAQNNSRVNKRLSMRKQRLQQITNQLEQQFENTNPLAQHAKALAAEMPKTPFTPFQGDRDLTPYYTLDNQYNEPHLAKLAKDKEYLGAGWRPEAVYERALDQAFMGLGCLVQQEKA